MRNLSVLATQYRYEAIGTWRNDTAIGENTSCSWHLLVMHTTKIGKKQYAYRSKGFLRHAHGSLARAILWVLEYAENTCQCIWFRDGRNVSKQVSR
jgi:hypothetical protein